MQKNAAKGKQADDFDSENEVKSNFVKFNVIDEDRILGTLVRIWESNSQFSEDKVTNYDIKADYGSFHTLDDRKKVIDEPITVGEGDIWTVGGKDAISRQMANIKIGQKVGFKFVDEKPSKTKGFAPAKLIKVYAPKNADGSVKMDQEFLEEYNSANAAQKDFDNLGK